MDCWTSPNNLSFASFGAHYLDEEFELHAFCLAVEQIIGPHTSENLAKFIKVIFFFD
jgi:hypothetical protein